MGLQQLVSRNLKNAFLISTMAVYMAGCSSSYKPPRFYEFQECERYAKFERFNSRVGARIIEEGEESEKLLGKNVIKKDYLPIIVIVRNEGTEDVMLRKEGVKYFGEDETRWEHVSGVELGKELAISNTIATAVTPGIFKGITHVIVRDYNQKLVQSLRDKILHGELRISPGKEEQGIVVLHKPKKTEENVKKIAEKGRIKVTLYNEKNEREEKELNE